MILLVDADSLIFTACYKTVREPEEDPFFQDLAEAKDKFDEVLFKIINDLNEMYDIDDTLIFANSKGNFRKLLDPNYKANRKAAKRPPLLPQIQEYVMDQYDAISKPGVETDDVVASYWRLISDDVGRDGVLIVSIDKDYKQLPCLMYDYHKKRQCTYDISERDALYNLYEQMIIGDTADNVNYCKGYGRKYAEKLLGDLNTRYQFSKAVYGLFKQIYKGKAREKYTQCYHLLKLREDLI